MCKRDMSAPPNLTVGLPSLDTGASYNASNNEAMVDLPEPERPTIAVHEVGAILKEMFCKTLVSGLEGYLKSKLEI